METLGALIKSDESQDFPEAPSDPIGALKFLLSLLN